MQVSTMIPQKPKDVVRAVDTYGSIAYGSEPHPLTLQSQLSFFFSSRRRHTRYWRDWSSDVCSSDLGIVEAAEWTIFGAQSAGCDPIATAFDNGWDVVKPVKPFGIAKSLNIGNPADGPYALDAIRRTGGAVGRVGDDEIVQGIRDLARTTGVFAETAGGVTVAVLRQLVGDGRLDPAEETVVLNTGEGLKTLDPLEPVVGPTHRVEPSLKSVRAAGLIG